MNKRPKSWDELRDAVLAELNELADMLTDAGREMRQFVVDVDGYFDGDNLAPIEEFWGFNYDQFIDLKDLPRLQEVINEWPQVKSQPGEGYW